MTLRVLLVDDQPLIRTGFASILASQEDVEVVGEAQDGREALELAAALDPDVVCMDVQMPRMDGIEATRRLVASGSRAAVLILTTFDTDDALFAALPAGASGFLLKAAGPEELIQALRVLGRGDALLDPQVTRRVLERMAVGPALEGEDAASSSLTVAPAPSTPSIPEQGAPSPGAQSPDAADGPTAGSPGPGPSHRQLPVTHPHDDVVPAGLTARETEVLRAMARGLSNDEIASELYVGRATVKTHVSNVPLKTGARDRVHAVIWAFERGLAGGCPLPLRVEDGHRHEIHRPADVGTVTAS